MCDECKPLEPLALSETVDNKAFSLHSSQVCSLLWMTRGDDAGWLDTKYIVMVSHTTACEDKLNNTYLLTETKWMFLGEIYQTMLPLYKKTLLVSQTNPM